MDGVTKKPAKKRARSKSPEVFVTSNHYDNVYKDCYRAAQKQKLAGEVMPPPEPFIAPFQADEPKPEPKKRGFWAWLFGE